MGPNARLVTAGTLALASSGVAGIRGFITCSAATATIGIGGGLSGDLNITGKWDGANTAYVLNFSFHDIFKRA